MTLSDMFFKTLHCSYGRKIKAMKWLRSDKSEDKKVIFVHPPPLHGSRSPLKNMMLLPNFSRTVVIFWKEK
jgi:hypothetical protein